MPKAMYGCEVSPVNEIALRTLRSSFADVLTYTTARRSADFTFSVVSGKTDLDPDVEIFVRRVTAMRRYITKSPANKEKMLRIYELYRGRGEPGIYQDSDQLSMKEVGGDPATKERSLVRNMCDQKGPCGLLLETIHLQGAALNGEFGVVQWNQPTIAIIEAPAQQVPYLTRQMATRTRTRRVEHEACDGTLVRNRYVCRQCRVQT